MITLHLQFEHTSLCIKTLVHTISNVKSDSNRLVDQTDTAYSRLWDKCFLSKRRWQINVNSVAVYKNWRKTVSKNLKELGNGSVYNLIIMFGVNNVIIGIFCAFSAQIVSVQTTEYDENIFLRVYDTKLVSIFILAISIIFFANSAIQNIHDFSPHL